MDRLAANARAVYETHYTEARMLQAYRQLYLDLVRAKCSWKQPRPTANRWRPAELGSR